MVVVVVVVKCQQLQVFLLGQYISSETELKAPVGILGTGMLGQQHSGNLVEEEGWVIVPIYEQTPFSVSFHFTWCSHQGP